MGIVLSSTPTPKKVASDGLGLCFKIDLKFSGYNLEEILNKEPVYGFDCDQICPHTSQSILLQMPNLL